MNQLCEQFRRLHDPLRGVRNEILIHLVDAMLAHGFQFRHLAPSRQRVATESALGP